MKRSALERLPHLLIFALVTLCGVLQVHAAGPQMPNEDYDPTGPPDNCCPFETRVGSYPLGTGWEEAHAAVDAGFYFGASDAGASVSEDPFYWPVDTNLQIYTDTRDVDVCVDESDPQSSLPYTATRPSWTVTPPSGRAYVATGNQLNYRPQVTGLYSVDVDPYGGSHCVNAGDTAEGGSFQFYVYSVRLRLVSETEPGEYDYGLSQGSPPATARGDEATISIEWGDGVTPPEEAEYSWHSSKGTAVLNGSGELAREWSGSMAETTTVTAEVSFHQQAVPNFLEQTYVGEVPVKHRDVNWMFTLGALVEHTPLPETLPIPGPINGSSVSMTEIGTDIAISAHNLVDFYTELHGSLNLPSHETESALIVEAAGELHRLRHDPCTTTDGLLGVYGEGLYPSVGFQYNYLRVVENLTFEPCTVDGPNGGLLYTNEPTGDWPVEIATNLNLYVPGSAYYNSTTPALMSLEATRVEEHERLHHTFWQMGIQLQAAARASNILAEPEYMEHWYSEDPMLALESLVISDSDLQSSDIGKAAAFSLAQLEAVSRMRAGFWGLANGGIWYRAGDLAIEAWPDHGGEDNASGARCP